MFFNVDSIRNDFYRLSPEEIYLKYIVKSRFWYFENYLGKSDATLNAFIDDFKYIVSNNLKVSFNSILLVGSGKTCYSFNPDQPFTKFKESPHGPNDTASDLDIAIISSDLFYTFWRLLRLSYSPHLDYYYKKLFRGLYRGYINDFSFLNIEPCQAEWTKLSSQASSQLYSRLFFKHQINYRIYRRWEDFEEYNLQSIKQIKEAL